MNRMLLLFGASLAFCAACHRTSPPDATPPPAAIKLPGEGELTRIRLTAEAEQRLGITTAVVERRALRRGHRLPAQTLLPPGALATVQAPFAGRVAPVADVALVAGAALAAGSTPLRLLPLPSADLRSNLVVLAEGARGRLARAEAECAVATLAATRTRQLLADKAGSQRAVDEAAAALAIAAAGRDAAAGELRALDTQLQAGELPAAELPVRVEHAGVVTAVHVQAGQLVPAGAPLFDLEHRAELWLRVDVPLALETLLADDEPVRFGPLTMLDFDAAATARPAEQPRRADPLTTSVARFFAFDNRDGRHAPGERLLAVLDERGPAGRPVARPTLPRAALLYDAGGGTWVYQQSGEHEFHRRRVDVAFVLDGQVAFESGPEVGAAVVVAGAAELFGTEFGAGK